MCIFLRLSFVGEQAVFRIYLLPCAVHWRLGHIYSEERVRFLYIGLFSAYLFTKSVIRSTVYFFAATYINPALGGDNNR